MKEKKRRVDTLRSLIQGEALIESRVDWIFCPNFISGEALITAGEWKKSFVYIGKKTKRLDIFLEY